MRLLPGMVMLMLALVIAGSARATTDVMPFKDEAQEQQFRQLTEQLRCPKCQNNSIADSNAMIATDMRRRVYDLMQEGKSRQEIIDYMVARYGNFVTYDPPLTPLTVLLWVLPLAAIVAGGGIIVARTRRRGRIRQDGPADALPAGGPRAGGGGDLPGGGLGLGGGAPSFSQNRRHPPGGGRGAGAGAKPGA
ncbi:cytochrome c-type biogenesis protein CcmH, partial [Salmonella enterica]|uniref:cytochrome c-type biogenesis protein n=1 Tax=Salmonella enterica TaxID=28901 RepID=UPI0007B466F3